MFWARHDIFLSYSHKDDAAVRQLADELTNRGYRVFQDTDSIRVGERWKVRIEKDLRSSRLCILCWSEQARASEFVSFEYACAIGLGKPVLPWLLDKTALPAMIEIHGVEEPDPQKAAIGFLPRLGWTQRARRTALLALLMFTSACACVVYWRTHLPPLPWDFSGRVTDSVTAFPLAGVRVEAEDRKFVAITTEDGTYRLHLPQPQPKYIDLVFLKEGYRGEISGQVHTDKPFNTDMVALK